MRPLRSLAAVSLTAVAVLGSCLPAQAVAQTPVAPAHAGDQRQALPAGSLQRADGKYTFDVSFCGIYEVSGDMDTETHFVRATLYAKIPVVGRLHVASLNGNLDQGVATSVNVLVAKGEVTMGIDNEGYVWIDPHLHIQFVGDTLDCKSRLFKLP